MSGTFSTIGRRAVTSPRGLTVIGVSVAVLLSLSPGPAPAAAAPVNPGVRDCTPASPCVPLALNNHVTSPHGGCLAGSADPACTVQVGISRVAIAKKADQTQAGPGDTVVYTVQVTNRGRARAIGKTFADDLTDVLDDADYNDDAVSSPTGSVRFTSPRLTWTGDIDPGQTITLTYSVTVRSPDGGDGKLNNVIAPGNPAYCDPGPCSAVVLPKRIALVVSKSVKPNPYSPGGPVTYTIVVANHGPGTAAGAQVHDEFPAKLQNANLTWTCEPSAGATCTASGDTAIDDTVTIPAGGKVTYTVTGRIPRGTTGDITNTATVTPPSNAPDPGCRPDCSATAVTRPGKPQIRLVKTADRRYFRKKGQRIRYSFKVTNTGTVPLSKLTVRDVRFTGAGRPPRITCPAGAAPLARGRSVTCTAVYAVTERDLYRRIITNTAIASGMTPDGRKAVSNKSTAKVRASVRPGPCGEWLPLVKRGYSVAAACRPVE